MDKKTVLLRADGGAEIGIGHLMRMRALGQALVDAGAGVSFAYQNAPEAVLKQLSQDRLHPIECNSLDVVLQDLKPDAVVFDGYHFSQGDFALARNSGANVTVMDDLGHLALADCDILINQNPGWDASHYAEFSGRLCLGLDFALLRREFYDAEAMTRNADQPVRNILVSGGGSDPQKIAFSTLETLEKAGVKALNIMILAGPAYRDIEHLNMAATLSSSAVTIARNTYDMVKALSWADVGVFAAGSSLWECAWSALPTLGLITADNQFKGARAMADAGAIVAMDWRDGGSVADLAQVVTLLIRNPDMRLSLAEKSQSLVDGQGARRVASVILDTCV